MTAALVAIRRGDPQPYADCWSHSDDVTLFGAWVRSSRAITTSPRRSSGWRAASARTARASQDFSTVHESGDLAVTVGMERGTAVVDGGEPFEMAIRTTHVYRREDGEWRLIHRHADFPPRDSAARTQKARSGGPPKLGGWDSNPQPFG